MLPFLPLDDLGASALYQAELRSSIEPGGEHLARTNLTEEESELIVMTPKQIAARVEWIARPGRRQCWKLHAPVFAEQIDEPMSVKGTVGETNWSFVLLFRKQNLRRLDMTMGGHTNPDGQELGRGQVHKHRWSETYDDKWAYIPDDIDLQDINTIFMSFLAESNIELIGEYQGLMIGAPPCAPN